MERSVHQAHHNVNAKCTLFRRNICERIAITADQFFGGAVMGATGPWQAAVVLAYGLIFIVPVWRILRRIGISGWWSLLALVPVVNVIALWALAFIRWPNPVQDQRAEP
jgi:uncharacterized membrane protein YhaH (DUF805 family)